VLDFAGVHALGHHRRLEQVGTMARKDASPRWNTHLVARPADALQAGGHRAW
jgi:hypothetical protein